MTTRIPSKHNTPLSSILITIMRLLNIIVYCRQHTRNQSQLDRTLKHYLNSIYDSTFDELIKVMFTGPTRNGPILIRKIKTPVTSYGYCEQQQKPLLVSFPLALQIWSFLFRFWGLEIVDQDFDTKPIKTLTLYSFRVGFG